MRAFTILVSALAVLPSALAASKSYIVWYDDATPDNIVEDAKKAIIDAGGSITHVYSLMKYVASPRFSQPSTYHNQLQRGTDDLPRGFAAIAPVSTMETLQVQTEHGVHVEEDEEVSNL
jgi:hypothetical protein